MIRKSKHTILEVQQALSQHIFDRKTSRIVFDGDEIKANSQRYQLFFTKGCKCVKCGIEGKFFAKERYPTSSRYHLNLYAIDKNGKEVLMTKDHIIPASKGGKNTLSNYQTLCIICNSAKGANIPEEET